MSNPVRPDLAAFEELTFLIRQVGEELGTFRKRALQAEQRLKTIATGAPGGAGMTLAAEERVAQLEAENARLREHITTAEAQTLKMLDQVRFLRQQHAMEGGA